MEKNVFDNELIWNWVDSIKDNEERYDATEKLLPTDIQSLVDIGCGHGGFLNLVAARRKTIRLFGVDSSDGALQSVTTDKIKASITKIPIGNGEFDCVTALEVIEHLGPDEFTLALEELSRVAKKYIVISVPYMEDLDWNNTICPNCKKKFHIDGHMQVFGKRKMEDLFKTKNFKCVKKFRFGWSKKFWLKVKL